MFKTIFARFIAFVFTILLFIQPNISLAATAKVPTPSLQDLKNSAASDGLKFIEKYLGPANIVASNASNPTKPYIKLDAQPSNRPDIRVPATEQFLISVRFRTEGKVMGSCLPGQWYEIAQDPSSVTYSFGPFVNQNMVKISQQNIWGNVTYSVRSTCCDEDSCWPCCKSVTINTIKQKEFVYRKIITVPKGTLDSNTLKATINVNAVRIIAGSVKVDCNNITDASISTSTNSASISIPVEVYTPLWQMFRLKKWLN